MYCYKCGQQIYDNTNVCPYCGAVQPVHATAENQYRSQYNLMGIIGFALSCISLLVNPYGIFAITGIILSIIGLVNSRKRNENGQIFAVLGIAIGAVVLIFFAVQTIRVYKYAKDLFDWTRGWGWSWYGNYF